MDTGDLPMRSQMAINLLGKYHRDMLLSEDTANLVLRTSYSIETLKCE